MFLRTSHVILEVFVAIVVVAALAGVVAMWRLSQGPVSLEAARPYLEQALSSKDGSLQFKLDSTVFQWAGWRRSLDLRGVGARMVGADGRVVASVPEVSVSFSLLALVRGVFAATRVELINPTVRLTRTKEGEFQFGFGRKTETTGEFLPGLLRTILSEPDSGSSLGLLKRISVVGAQLTVNDEILGISWHAPKAEFELGPDGNGLEAAYHLEVAFDGRDGESNPVFEGTANFVPGDQVVRFDMAFRHLNPQRLSPSFPSARFLKAFQLPLRGRAKLEMDVRRSVRTVDFEIRSGRGQIDLPRIFDDAVTLDAGFARGRYDADSQVFRLHESSFEIGGGEFQFRATMNRAGAMSAISGDLLLADVSVANLQRLWPGELAPNARSWVRRNMEGGASEGRASFFLRLPAAGSGPPSVDTFAATLNIRGTSVHYLRPLSPVTGTDATLVFGRDRVDMTVRNGELNGLQVSDGTIAITGFNDPVTWFDLEAVAKGNLRNALEVLDHPRMQFIKGRGVRTEAVGGRSATRLKIRLPLDNDLKLREVEVQAAANLRDVSIIDVVPGYTLTDGALNLRLNSNNMSIVGDVRLANAMAKLRWYENFEAKAPFVRRYELEADVGKATLAALKPGFDITLDGVIPAKIVMTERSNTAADLKVRLELKPAAIAIPLLGWRKSAGRPGGAVFDMTLVNGRPSRVRQLHVRSESLTISARAQLARDGKTLLRANLSEFVVGDKTEITGRVMRLPEQGLQVNLKGTRFNAVPFARLFDGEHDAGSVFPPMTVKANVRRVWVRPRVSLNFVDATLQFDGTVWDNIFMVGELSKARRLAVGYIDRAGQAKLTMEASDAGATLKTFGIVDDVEGGVLNVSAVRSGKLRGDAWRGRLTVRNFKLRKAPGFARLLSLASLAGIADVMAGEGLAFSRLILPFSLGKGRLEIVEARAVGSAIGITATGNIVLGDERIDLKGTLIPAYTINSVLGNIPILGRLLTGGKGKGIFAATYSIKGPLEQPKVVVNPLAALAPGFLRGLFQGIIDGGAPTDPLPEPQMQE